MPAPKSKPGGRSGGSEPGPTATRPSLDGVESAGVDSMGTPAVPEGPTTMASHVGEQITSGLRPLDLVVLTRERIQDTLDEFAERGRVTRTDANDLVAELVRRGREPTDGILDGFGVGPAFPILGYDELTAGQVGDRLAGLTPPQLRKVRDYERRHANRKTALEAIEKAL